MNPVKPDPEKFIVPMNTFEVEYQAPKDMPECLPLPTIRTGDGKVACQWMPTPGELALMAEGVPVTVVLYCNGQLPPLAVGVGGMDLR